MYICIAYCSRFNVRAFTYNLLDDVHLCDRTPVHSFYFMLMLYCNCFFISVCLVTSQFSLTLATMYMYTYIHVYMQEDSRGKMSMAIHGWSLAYKRVLQTYATVRIEKRLLVCTMDE